MPDSTAAHDFKLSVLRAFDAASREAAEDRERVRKIELALERTAGAAEASAITPKRIAELEAAAIAPERMRELETKVTQLQVRSGIIGAIAGIIATGVVQAALKWLFAHGPG